MVLMNVFARKQHKHREQTCRHSGGRRGWDELRVAGKCIHDHICKIGSQWEFAVMIQGAQTWCSVTT